MLILRCRTVVTVIHVDSVDPPNGGGSEVSSDDTIDWTSVQTEEPGVRGYL